MKKRLCITYNAPVTLSIVFISLIATILGTISKGTITTLLFSTYRASLINPLTYVRLFTHVFGHSGWTHFIGNASYLLLLGPALEEKHGSLKVLQVAAFTALFTSVINFIFFPSTALCGASGVVFAFIILMSFTSFRQGEIPLTFIVVAAIYIGQQIYEGIFLSDNVSNLSHIIGGIVGAVSGFVLNIKKQN